MKETRTMLIPTRKLDGFARRNLESGFRQRQDAETAARHKALTERFTAAALERLHAEYGPMQADMPVLEKYKLSSDIEGVNFNVYNPATKRWDDRFGLRLAGTGLKAPGNYNSYVSFHIRPEDSDYELAREIIDENSFGRDRDKAAREAFAKEIRATVSWRKLMGAHPWIAERFAMAEAA